MNTVLGDKLQTALNDKKQDVNSYFWKLAKREVAGQRVQSEVKLMDATAEQLQTFYNHCQSMLYNEQDKNNPGRYILKDIIADQTLRCNTQLYMMYVRDRVRNEDGTPISDFTYRSALIGWLKTNKISPKDYGSINIQDTTDVDAEFNNIPVSLIIDATLEKLGIFDKKHITLNFLTKLGIWFTADEIRELSQKAKEHETDRLNYIKEELGLRSNISIRTNPKGLTYKEFKAMIHLRKCRYQDLTRDQLLTLRNKVLFELDIEVNHHIEQWEERREQILTVAKLRGIEIELSYVGE